MGRFLWLLLLTRVLPASITITLHQHTPLIIIGVADAAFNSCLCLYATLRTTGTLDFVYMHHIILLYTTHPSFPHSSHTTYFQHFSDTFNSSTRMSFSLTIPKKQVTIFPRLALVYHHTPGLISVYNCARANMMQLSYGFTAPACAACANFRDAGEY